LETITPIRDNQTGITILSGEPVVFHCNHYNRSLQMLVEECKNYLNHIPILQDSATEVSYRQLRQLFEDRPAWGIPERIAAAERIYRYCGFGDLDLSNAMQGIGNGIQVIEHNSHYGCALRLNDQSRRKPGEFFDLGFAIGALAATYDKPMQGRILAEERHKPISLRGDKTAFLIEPRADGSFPLDTQPIAHPELPSGADQVPPRTIGLHIDEEAIIESVASLPLQGDDKGLISAFGVGLTRHYADYYNLVSYRFENALAHALATHKHLGEMLWFEYSTLFFYKAKFGDIQGKTLAQTLLIEAGHICGFQTMGGIMRSDPWYQLVVPQLHCKEDWLAGIIACINALGWGIWRIIEVVPNERLVLRAWYPYESLGYLRILKGEKSDHPIDFLMAGVASAIMNLLYNIDITTKPELTLKSYYQTNRSKGGFWAKQTSCMAMGDPYSEVIVERL